VAAGIAAVPEASEHTSIKARVDHVKDQGRTEDLKAAQTGSVAGSNASAGLEESHWLCPMEDRRRLDSAREGMLEGFSLGNYLLLVNYTGRLFRKGNAAISREVAEVFDRLGTTAETWQAWKRAIRFPRLPRTYRAALARLQAACGRGYLEGVYSGQRFGANADRPVREATLDMAYASDGTREKHVLIRRGLASTPYFERVFLPRSGRKLILDTKSA